MANITPEQIDVIIGAVHLTLTSASIYIIFKAFHALFHGLFRRIYIRRIESEVERIRVELHDMHACIVPLLEEIRDLMHKVYEAQ